MVRGPNAITALKEAGDTGMGTNRVVPYLQSVGIPPTAGLDYTIVGHQHCDHNGGLDEVITAGYDVRVRNYYNASTANATNTCVTGWKNKAKNNTTAGYLRVMQPDPTPKHDWARHSLRMNDIIDNQVRSLRKHNLIEAFKNQERTGAYWGIRTNIANDTAPNTLPCPEAKTLALAATPTRLAAVPDVLQERLINWGYAVTDAAMRTHVDKNLRAPTAFPYAAGIG